MYMKYHLSCIEKEQEISLQLPYTNPSVAQVQEILLLVQCYVGACVTAYGGVGHNYVYNTVQHSHNFSGFSFSHTGTPERRARFLFVFFHYLLCNFLYVHCIA